MQKFLTGSVPSKVKIRNDYQYSFIDRSSVRRNKIIKDYVFSPEHRVIGI